MGAKKTTGDDAAWQGSKVFYTIADVQKRWGISRATVYREVERGRLKRKLIGGQVRFGLEEIRRYEADAG